MGLINSDLRIWNLVVYKRNVYRISDILSSKSVILYGMDESIKTNEIEGFLIDESILNKLGAEKITTKGSVRYKIKIRDFLTLYFSLETQGLSSSYLFVSQNSERGARFNHSIKFIHELQNLFSLFNNEELDIDLLIRDII